MAAPSVENVVLIDADNNKEYIITVSAEDAEKARKDMKFATTLLQVAKNQQQCESANILSVSDIASTSSEINTSTLTSESTEGTHIWHKNETILLLTLYNNYKDKFNSGKGTTKQYWNKIASKMNEEGYKVSGLKCTTKFQALKRTYKSVIDHNKKSGNSRKEWEYFKYMEELFGDKPWVAPVSVAGSHMSVEENENVEEKENILERRTKKRKLNNAVEEYLLNIKEEQEKKREMRERHHEEKMNYMKRIENIMDKFLEQKK